MKFKDNINLHLLIIVILSLTVRFAAGFIVGHGYEPQTWEYEKLARSLLDKGTFSMNYREYGEYKALLGPGYPFLTFFVYKIFGINHMIMLIVQFLLMTLFSVSIYGIAWMFFRKGGIALIAGVLSVLHPGLIYYSSANLHEFNLYMPLFYGTILTCILACKTNEWKYFILFGFLGGTAVLTRATVLPVLVLCMAFCAIFPFEGMGTKNVLKASAALLLLVLINLPWVIRNYEHFHQFVFSQTNKWEAFWIGNNPNSSGGQYRTDGTGVLSLKGAEMQKKIDANVNNEIAVEDIFRDYTFKYAKENPENFIKGLFRKGFYFWWFYPQTGLFYPKIYLVAYKILYVFLLLLTAIGLYMCNKEKLWCVEMLFPLFLIFGIWGVHTMNFSEMRHRWTVEPVLLIFASVSIFFLAEKIYQYFLVRKQPFSHPIIQQSLK